MKNKILSLIILLLSVQSLWALEIPVVAVFDFEADNVSDRTAYLCASFLRKHLVDIGRVRIKERDEMDKMLQAQGENLESCTEEGCAVKLGQFLDVEKIITGKVTKTGSRYIVIAKFINLENAQIEFQEEITEENITEDKLTDYIQSLAEKIAGRVTLIGSVIETGDEILLDIGKAVGIQVGDRYLVKRWGREIRNPQTNELLEKEKLNIGEIKINRLIGDKVSACSKVSGSGYQVGDFIEYKGAIRTSDEVSGGITPSPISPAVPVSAGNIYGSVSISTDPSGALVYLDGDDYGKTPVRRDDVETGEYTLALHKDGYVDVMQMLTVSRGRTAEVDVKLVKQMGSLKITCTPSDAHIYLDGTYKGTAGSQGLKLDYLSVGSHTVKAETESYYPDEKSVEVYHNQTAQVSFSLRHKPGSVFVMSTPGGADIYIDNKKQTGKTPSKVNDVPTGTHKVKAYLDGYQTEEKSVIVEAEKTANVSYNLVKVMGNRDDENIKSPSQVLKNMHPLITLGGYICLETSMGKKYLSYPDAKFVFGTEFSVRLVKISLNKSINTLFQYSHSKTNFPGEYIANYKQRNKETSIKYGIRHCWSFNDTAARVWIGGGGLSYHISESIKFDQNDLEIFYGHELYEIIMDANTHSTDSSLGYYIEIGFGGPVSKFIELHLDMGMQKVSYKSNLIDNIDITLSSEGFYFMIVTNIRTY